LPGGRFCISILTRIVTTLTNRPSTPMPRN
jgi:hypothetical protein